MGWGKRRPSGGPRNEGRQLLPELCPCLASVASTIGTRGVQLREDSAFTFPTRKKSVNKLDGGNDGKRDEIARVKKRILRTTAASEFPDSNRRHIN